MGKTDPDAPLHKQQSMIVVPMDAPGVTIVRPLTVFGSEDPPRECTIMVTPTRRGGQIVRAQATRVEVLGVRRIPADSNQ